MPGHIRCETRRQMYLLGKLQDRGQRHWHESNRRGTRLSTHSLTSAYFGRGIRRQLLCMHIGYDTRPRTLPRAYYTWNYTSDALAWAPYTSRLKVEDRGTGLGILCTGLYVRGVDLGIFVVGSDAQGAGPGTSDAGVDVRGALAWAYWT